MVKTAKKIFGTIALSVALMSPSGASANQIMLTFVDHGFTITAQFSKFTGDSYIVMTEHGRIRVPASMVTCTGSRCVGNFQLA